MTYTLALFFSMLLTTVLAPPLMAFASRIGMVDVPDARKVHSGAIPRSGGIALIIGALAPLFFLAPSKPLMSGICLGGLVILVEGFIDDLWGLRWRLKFSGQVLAAVLTVYATDLHFITLGRLIPGCAGLDCGLLGYPLTVLFLVATTNIINLSDGLDGLAGGICLLIFSATGFLAFLRGDYTTIAFCVCMVGAIVGFLRYNTHPAVVFLGDAGSQFLGFMAGVTMLLFTAGGVRHSPIVAMYLLGVPVLDTLMAIVRRAAEKRPLFEPDASHLHHKLLQLGLKHHQAVTVVYIAQLLMITAVWTLRWAPDAILFGLYLCVICFAVVAAALPFLRLSERLPHPGPGNGGQDQKVAPGRPEGLFSASSISGAASVSLMASLLVFFVFSPVWTRPVATAVGFYSLAFILVLAAVRVASPSLVTLVAKTSGYFLAIYYVVTLDFSADVPGLLWYRGDRAFLFAVFSLMAVSYLVFLITSVQKVRMTTMDHLLLGLVALTFLLPEPVKVRFHVHTIAAKVLLVFLSLEVVMGRLRGRKDLLAAAALSSLAMNLSMALWPWLI